MLASDNTLRTPRTALVASDTFLVAWNERVSNASDITTIAAGNLTEALDALERTDPEVVVVEQEFAATISGGLLMARLHDERCLRGLDIRLLSPTRVTALFAAPQQSPTPSWLTDFADPVVPRPNRRAARLPVKSDVQASLDGISVGLVDISSMGVQLHSPEVLRPGQNVRLVFSIPSGRTKAAGTVIWSAFDIGPPTRYRAGIALTKPLPDVGALAAPPMHPRPR